jgi:hypothetical protein
MEASGGGATRDGPPVPGGAQEQKVGVGWRVVAVVAGVVFAFFGVALMAYLVKVGGDPPCDQVTSAGDPCWETSTEKTVALITAGAAAALGTLVLPLGIYFAATGRGSRLVAGTAAAFIVVLALGALLTPHSA